MHKFLGLVLLLGCLSCVKNDEQIKLSVNKHQSSVVALTDNTVKSVVVFWKASCGPCIREINFLNKQSIPVVAVNVSGEDLDSETRNLSRRLDEKLNSHIKVIADRKVFELLDVGFVPFGVMVENQAITKIYSGYTEEL